VGVEISVPHTPSIKPKKDKPPKHHRDMPGRRVVVETDSHGYPVKVVRRHSHHGEHHHHHPHLPHLPHLHWDHHADITPDELATLRERERILTEANQVLHRENQHLKSNLHAAETDLRHHRSAVASLQANVRSLAVENGELRRSLESYQGIEERHKAADRVLRNKNTRLENDNAILRERIRDLGREVKEGIDERVRVLKEEVAGWARRWEDLDRRLRRMRGNLDEFIRRNEDLGLENSALRRANTLLERRLARHRLL
jgi:regulator of replication initiation timing